MPDARTSEEADRAQRVISHELDIAPLPVFDAERRELLDGLAERLRIDPIALGRLRAAYLALTASWNRDRVTFAFVARLSDGEWMPAEPALSVDSAERFCRRPDLRPRAHNVLLLLMVLRLLRKYRHPSLNEPIASALVSSVAQLDALDDVIERTEASTGRSRIRRLCDMADGLYEFLGGGSGVLPDEIDEVAGLPLFAGLRPAMFDKDVGAHRLFAVRLSPRRGEYVASTVRVSLLERAATVAELGFDHEPVRMYLHLESLTEEEGEVVVRSHGFIIPRARSLYFVQYHIDGAGLNVSFFSASELREVVHGFTKGLILTFDRVQHSGGLASRIAVFRLEESEKPPGGNVTRRELLEWLVGRPPSGKKMAARILRFLHEESEISIRPLSLPGVAENMSSWGDVVHFATKVPKDSRTETITGHLNYPLSSA